MYTAFIKDIKKTDIPSFKSDLVFTLDANTTVNSNYGA